MEVGVPVLEDLNQQKSSNDEHKGSVWYVCEEQLYVLKYVFYMYMHMNMYIYIYMYAYGNITYLSSAHCSINVTLALKCMVIKYSVPYNFVTDSQILRA